MRKHFSAVSYTHLDVYKRQVYGFIGCFALNEFRGIARCDFSLLDGDVNDIERAAHITCRKDVRLGGLHAVIDDDLGFVQGDFGGVQSEALRGGYAAHGEED